MSSLPQDSGADTGAVPAVCAVCGQGFQGVLFRPVSQIVMVDEGKEAAKVEICSCASCSHSALTIACAAASCVV